MQSGSLTKFFRLFNTEISLKHIYWFLLEKLTGLKTLVKEYKFDDFPLNIKDSSTLSKEISLKTFNPLYVLVRKKDIDYQVKFNANPDFFKISLPNIQTMQPVYTMVKWKSPDLSVITIYRNYPLTLSTKLNTISSDKVSLTKRAKLNQIDNDKIALDRRVKVTQEIIEISPYTRILRRKELYKIPITKTPLYKAFFSEEEMDNFKETLARQNKTRKSNVEILSIYDKLNIEIYSSIKQDQSSKCLVCHPNIKPVKFNQDKMYYLIIGNRKDNKVSIKALVRLDKKQETE